MSPLRPTISKPLSVFLIHSLLWTTSTSRSLAVDQRLIFQRLNWSNCRAIWSYESNEVILILYTHICIYLKRYRYIHINLQLLDPSPYSQPTGVTRAVRDLSSQKTSKVDQGNENLPHILLQRMDAMILLYIESSVLPYFWSSDVWRKHGALFILILEQNRHHFSPSLFCCEMFLVKQVRKSIWAARLRARQVFQGWRTEGITVSTRAILVY